MEEDKIKKERIIHHGHNVKLARWDWKKLQQSELAELLNMNQTAVSRIEQQEVIDDKTLKKISGALNIPLSFLKEFNLPDTMNYYMVKESGNGNEFTITAEENSTSEVNIQKIVKHEETINNSFDNISKLFDLPLGEISKLYERLLKHKEDQIAELIARLKEEKK